MGIDEKRDELHILKHAAGLLRRAIEHILEGRYAEGTADSKRAEEILASGHCDCATVAEARGIVLTFSQPQARA